MFKFLTKIFLFTFSVLNLNAQTDTCIFKTYKHQLKSKYSDVQREYWVGLPMRYDSTKSYPVLYVFDAEWRFNLIWHMAYDLAGNKKIPHHIVIGIPHVDWEFQRGIDLTFSQSRTGYDGEAVDSTFYNDSNAGGGMNFYNYLTKELIKDVDSHYSTNGKRVIIGHSYGGYFAGYILPFDKYFSAYQIYDPSIWYSDGEVINNIKNELKPANVFITYQPVPTFHRNKIKRFIKILKKDKNIILGKKEFKNETHNSLYLQSFLNGMDFLYSDFNGQKIN